MRQILSAVAVMLLPSAILADTDPYQSVFNKTGFIHNGGGEKCWYTQTYEETNPYFMKDSMKNTTHHDVRTIRFNDPDCMANKYDAHNKILINEIISRWFLTTYVQADAVFDTQKLHHPSEFQSHGRCIQSRIYPSQGILIEYFYDGDNISGVSYTIAIGGCGDVVR